MTTQTDAKPANKMVFKVIDFEGDIRAQTVFAEDAASMVAFLGDGATVEQIGRKGVVLWREGSETESASESFDLAAKTIHDRILKDDAYRSLLASAAAKKREILDAHKATVAQLKAAHQATPAKA